MIEKPRDIEREESERTRTPEEFRDAYNKRLPTTFPRATLPLLIRFKKEHPNVFKRKDTWTLGEHRKKFMDWLPQYLKDHSRSK